MPTRWMTALCVLVPAAACLAAGCNVRAMKGDSRTKSEIRKDHAEAQQELAAKQADLSRLKAGLLEEGWTHNEAGDLAPPHGLHRGDQVRKTQERLNALEKDIAALKTRLDRDRRVWRERGYEVAELTRDAATQVSPPAHRD
ncbi:MAG: hypothetical protein R6X20_16695 [Phycisphaerae bacterium]